MPPREDRLRLRHMLDHAREAHSLLQGKDRSHLANDRVLGLALVRLLEIIGEAAGKISAESRTMCSFIPWPQIIGLRNRLIHGYDAVDMDIVWAIVANDIPPLVASLETCLGED